MEDPNASPNPLKRIDSAKVDVETNGEINDSPIDQVRLTVPITDDPTQPCLTFRTWVLGITSCVLLSFLNQFFAYRQNPLSISSVAAQIVVLPIGKLMAATLPKKTVRIHGTSWSFSLNPGPFNLKEHVLITIFANSGSSRVYAVGIVTIVKAFYGRGIHPLAALLLVQTTQASLPKLAFPIILSIFFVIAYGLNFATLAASVSHVALFHGRYSLLCEGFGGQLQLPYWGILLAVLLASLFTLPVGVITATTNQQPGLNVITELIIGYLYPGKPLANVAFKTYGYISIAQAINFLSDFKLGQYMKIPPKSMFIAQLVGTILASAVYFGTSWWLLTTVDHICDPSKLPQGSRWTCPGDDVFYYASIIWGLVGPRRMFGNLGLYSKMNYFFLIGILSPLPFWLLSKKFPEQKWIRLVNMPVLLSGPGPPVRAVNFNMWFAVGIFFNFVVYKRFKGWWAKHNYILSAALDAGVAFMGILCYFTLQISDINGPKWWGQDVDDHCPLAGCPTAPGIVTKGCPAVK